MSMPTFNKKCESDKRDHIEGDVVGGHVYLSVVVHRGAAQNDVSMTPESARELAEWLQTAALVAEQYES
jgi:hypothetical protein